MKPSYRKLVSEFLKNKTHTPKGMKFQFENAGISREDFPAQITFLDKNKAFFSSFPKSMDYAEIQLIFEWINRSLNTIQLNDQNSDQTILIFLNYLEIMLGVIKDERHWLFFDQHNKLLEIANRSTNIDVILVSFKILFLFFKTKPKVNQIITHCLSEDDIQNIFLTILLWTQGISLLNKSPLSFSEKIHLSDFNVFKLADISTESNYNCPLVLAETSNHFRAEKIAASNKVEVDIFKYFDSPIEEVLKDIEKTTNLKINSNSLNSRFLMIRLLINRFLIKPESQQINEENRQKMMLLTLIGITFCKTIAKNSELNEQYKKVFLIFDSFAFGINCRMSFDLLEGSLFCKYEQSFLFSSVLFHLYHYYMLLNETSNDQMTRIKVFFQTVLEKVHEETYLKVQEKPSLAISSTSNSLFFTMDAKTITELLKLISQIFVGENRFPVLNNTVENVYIYELIVNIQSYYIQILTEQFDEEIIHILIEINRIFLHEIDKDKEFTFFEIFSSNLKSFLGVFYAHKAIIQDIEGIYCNINMLVFEVTEAIESYFIEPIKSSNNFKVPKMARLMLDNEFWESPEICELVIEYPSFKVIFNELIVLLNDLMNNVSEVYLPSYVLKFSDNGFLPLVLGRIGVESVANEYDSLGFLLNLFSKVISHNKDLVDTATMEMILKTSFDQIFTRSAVISNYKRFNGGDSNTALKNFADEVVTFCNVHSSYVPFVSKLVISQMKELKQINGEIAYFVTNSLNLNDFVGKINSAELMVKRFGWFCNINGTALNETDISDELILYQKTGSNYIKFLSRFFDNLNTNIYSAINDDYKDVFKDKCVISFVIKSFTNALLYFDGARKKKMVTLFIRVSFSSHNETFLKLIEEHIIKIVPHLCYKLKQVVSTSSQKEIKEAYSILFDKYHLDRKLFEFNFEALTEKTLKIVKNYSFLMCLIDIMKTMFLTHRRNSSIPQVIPLYPILMSTVAIVDQEFIKNSEYIFKRQVLEDLNSQMFEVYFEGTKNPDVFNFAMFFKLLKQSSETFGCEALNDLILRLTITKPRMESFRGDFPVLYLSKFITEIDRVSSQTIMNYHSIVSLHFNLNAILEGLNMMHSFNENCDHPVNQNELLFFLSKAKFFSVTIPNLMRFLLSFIAKLKKQIKKIFMTKAEKNEIFINSAFYIFIIEGKLSELCRFVQIMLEKIMKFIPFEIEIGEKSPGLQYEVQISKTIEFERLKTILALINTMKSVSQEAFECFYLKDKSSEYFDASLLKKRNKPAKPQNVIQSEPETIQRTFEIEDKIVEGSLNPQTQENIPFKVSKADLLSNFVMSFKNLLDVILTNITHNFECPDISTSQPKISYFELLEPESKNNLNLFFTEMSLFRRSSPRLTKKYVQEFKYMHFESEEAFCVPNSNLFLQENTLQLTNFKEEVEKVKKEIESSVDLLVIFFFNNWLYFSKARMVLKNLWESSTNLRHKDDKEAKVKLLRKMLSETQVGLKLCIEGKTSRTRVRNEWRLIVKEKESILNILYLQLDLFGLIQNLQAELLPIETLPIYFNELNAILIEDKTIVSNEESQQGSNQVNRPKKLESIVNYLLLLIQKNLNPKFKKDKVQKLIISCFLLLEKMTLTAEDKLSIIECIQQIFNFHTFRPISKEKEKVTLVNDKVVRSIVGILCVIFENDELILEKISLIHKFEVIKSLLRVKIEKGISLSLKNDILNKFKALTEIILRQPHVFNLLIECEIKCYLFNEPNHTVELEKFTNLFFKPLNGYEKMVAQVFSNICETYVHENGKKMIRLAKNQEFTTRHSEIRGYVTDFVSLLINDVLFKIQKQNHLQEPIFIFNHLIVCETLFYQILPRYPIFYSSALAKQKVLFMVHFVEKYIDVYHGYFQFVAPIFFDFPPLTKDQNGQIISISQYIRSELINKVLSILETKTTELIKVTKNQKVEGLSLPDRENLIQTANDCVHSIENAIMFLLKAMKSENFNKELEQKKVFSKLTELFEGIFYEAINSKLTNSNHMLNFLLLPDLLRRRQVMRELNQNEFALSTDKDNHFTALHIPTTFRFPPSGWIQSRSKASTRSFGLLSTKDISYEHLIPKSKIGKTIPPIYTYSNRMNRRQGRFFTRILNDEGGLGVINDEPFFMRHRNNEFLVEQEEEDDPQEDDIDEDGENDLSNSSSGYPSPHLYRDNRIRNTFDFSIENALLRDEDLNRRNFQRNIFGVTGVLGSRPSDSLRNPFSSQSMIDMLTNNLNQLNAGNDLGNSVNNFLRRLEPRQLISDPVNVPINTRNDNSNRTERTVSESQSEESNQDGSRSHNTQSQRGSFHDGEERSNNTDDLGEDDEGTENLEEIDEQENENGEDDEIEDDETSNDISDDTDEERLSEDVEDNDNSDGLGEMEFDEQFEENSQEESVSSAEDEDDHVEFIEDENYRGLDIMIDMQSQQSGQQEFQSIFNFAGNTANATNNMANTSFRKLFVNYPFMLPLNLINKHYLYYIDLNCEAYMDILEQHILPYSSNNSNSYFQRIKKEFLEFQSIFATEKGKQGVFGLNFNAFNDRQRDIRPPILIEGQRFLEIEQVNDLNYLQRDGMRRENGQNLQNREARRTGPQVQTIASNPLLSEILRSVLNEQNALENTPETIPRDNLSAQPPFSSIRQIMEDTFGQLPSNTDNQHAIPQINAINNVSSEITNQNLPDINLQQQDFPPLSRLLSNTSALIEQSQTGMTIEAQNVDQSNSITQRLENNTQNQVVNQVLTSQQTPVEINLRENANNVRNQQSRNSPRSLVDALSRPRPSFLRRTNPEIIRVGPQTDEQNNNENNQAQVHQDNNQLAIESTTQNPEIVQNDKKEQTNTTEVENNLTTSAQIQPPVLNQNMLIEQTSSINDALLIQNQLNTETQNLMNRELPPLGQLPVESNTQNQIEQPIIQFDFAGLGLPNNFLEIAGIDPTFFEALPYDFQVDTVMTLAVDMGILQPGHPRPAHPSIHPNVNQTVNQLPNQAPQMRASEDSISVSHAEMRNVQDNNFTFVESLPADIRNEVLTTCPQEFLLTLPEHIQQEAQRLRDQGYVQDLDDVEEEGASDNNNQNLPSNRIKQSIKKNKQKELIKKHFNNKSAEEKLYPTLNSFLDCILALIKDQLFPYDCFPISYLSSILFNIERQEYFYIKLLEIIETQEKNVKLRALTVLEILTYSNFHFFHEKRNFDRVLWLLKDCKSEEQLLHKLTRTINHIVKTMLVKVEDGEGCEISINQENLDHLTCILYSKNQSLFDALSVILFMLSFNNKNLELIIESLQENIAKLAFSLNMKFDEILLLDQKSMDSENYFNLIAVKINEKLSLQNGILKIFKLLEQLFKRSFSLNFNDDKNEGEAFNNPEDAKNKDEKSTKFNEIKNRILASFANYFKQTNIKLLFLNMFKVLHLYEPVLDSIIEKKRLSKPIFTKLLPIIESFFIIYKLLCDEEVLRNIKVNLQLKEVALTDVQIASFNEQVDQSDGESIKSVADLDAVSCQKQTSYEEIPQTKLANMSKSKSKPDETLASLTIESMFYRGIRNSKNIFNYLLNQIPKIGSSPLSVIIRHTPRLVNFETKRKYFNQAVQSLKTNAPLKLIIRRANLFHDSYTQINTKSPAQLRGKLSIKFQDEEGVDAGGVQREWYNELSKEIFNPNYALFVPAVHGYAYQPSAFSTVNIEHLSYFKFIGKIFGRVLIDGNLMDAHFTRSFYKHMTGTPLNFLDLEDYDSDYFRTIKWILENDVEDLDLDFTYEREIFGVKQFINLKPSGSNVKVTNENKAEYVRLVCEQKLTEEIRAQIKSFLEGLNSVVPPHLIKMFDFKELELMFSGMPEIDLQDLKSNTEYVDFNENSLTIQYFWEVMKEFDESMKAGFLQFVTGTSKVPLEGFSNLKGMGGIQRLNIHKAFDNKKLPTSHTCMNQLDLPAYESKEELKEKLTKAIIYGKEGFGFA